MGNIKSLEYVNKSLKNTLHQNRLRYCQLKPKDLMGTISPVELIELAAVETYLEVYKSNH